MSGDVQVAAGSSRILDAVRRYWGYDRLRPMQEEAILAGLAHRDSLVVMPTGGGKSLCYQVPPIVAGRTDVVVSPLISLMKDQVDGLRACGYPAAGLHSGMEASERRDVVQGIRAGRFRLVFVSPERLLGTAFIDLVGDLGVRGFAIDEAHCISHWGHDFRPEYRQLAQLKTRFPGASVHAFTATATPRVRDDVIGQLGLDEPRVLVGPCDRPNLVYRIVPRTDVAAQVLTILRRHPREAVIVYCMTRRETETLAAVLRANGIEAEAYHAGLDAGRRRRTQDAFSAERLDVVVATVAFGMGIDRSSVRCVVHTAMPKSVEHYQQETGRAGRDGLEAECVLLYSAADVLRWKGLIERGDGEWRGRAREPGQTREQEHGARPADDPDAPGLSPGADRGQAEALAAQLELLAHMQGICGTLECRHRALSRYFGQPYERDDCGACDVCLDEIKAMPDSTEVAQKILSCVARMEQRFGVGQVVQVLRGADTDTVRRWGHDRLSTYGLLEDVPEKALTNLVYQLIDQDLLARSPGDRPVLQLNERSIDVLRGRRAVRLVEPRRAKAKVDRSRAAEVSWEGVDRDLFERLRVLRREIAIEREVPPYVIFDDKALRDMARIRPQTLEAMRSVRGVGEKKLADLAPRFLEAIRGAVGTDDAAAAEGEAVDADP